MNWTTSSLARSSCPKTTTGTPPASRGTSPSTSGRSPSSIPASAHDVVTTVGLAAERGIRIAFNAGGHNAGPIDWSGTTLLLKTERMDGIEIDVAGRRARIERACCRSRLAIAAGAHGLAYLAGTSPNVGVLGYALGGGLSWMIRKFGLACNSIVAAEVVTADGRVVRTDHETEPELFWALRGGGGNVAAVTDIELELFPIAEIYAGALLLADRAGVGYPHGLAWVDRDRARYVRIPGPHAPASRRPVPPEPVRGRSFVLVEAACIGTPATGRR